MRINVQKFHEDFKDKKSPIQHTIPKVKLYEVDLSKFAERQEQMVSEEEVFASFSKACVLNTSEDGLRSPGFWSGFYDTMIGNNFEFEGHALGNAVGSTNCVMQFLPSSCTNKAAGMIFDIAESKLGRSYKVVPINGNHTTNQKSEQEAKDAVVVAKKEGKKVWFISQGMSSRSFSVPEIDTVILTYDGGDLGATLQKMSRAFTAGEGKDLGKVVSVSIDPNREDKIASIILSSAQKAAEQNGTDLNKELKKAYATFPLFSVDATGNQLEVREDDYIERAMSLESSIPLAVNRSAIITLKEDTAYSIIDQILHECTRGSRVGEKSALQKGKRYIDQKRKGKATDHNSDSYEKALNTIAKQLDAWVHNLDIVRWMVDSDEPQLSDVLKEADRDPVSFEQDTGMSPTLVRLCLDAGLLRASWVDSILLQLK